MTAQPSLFDHPIRPREEARQHVLPVRGTIEERYRAWRATEDGAALWDAFCREAVTQASLGARRLSGKGIAETIRARLRRHLNNSHVALLVRDCEAAHPVTADRFEKRRRVAT